MSLMQPKFAAVAWRVAPEPIRRRLAGTGGKRLVRFAPAAVLALAATQITYFIVGSLLHAGGFTSGAVGWFAGFVVSYGVSRWAWERKGKPDLLRETLPFLVIALMVGVVLTLTSKFAYVKASSMDLTGIDKTAFTQGLYIAANCVTFLIRFMIFHYILFANRVANDSEPTAAESLPAPAVSGSAVSRSDAETLG
jgi:putative flippase GtrA